MTYDKIKFYMNPIIFNFWVNCKDLNVINRAKNQIKLEIDNKLLVGIEYMAELKLLEILS